MFTCTNRRAYCVRIAARGGGERLHAGGRVPPEAGRQRGPRGPRRLAAHPHRRLLGLCALTPHTVTHTQRHTHSSPTPAPATNSKPVCGPSTAPHILRAGALTNASPIAYSLNLESTTYCTMLVQIYSYMFTRMYFAYANTNYFWYL